MCVLGAQILLGALDEFSARGKVGPECSPPPAQPVRTSALLVFQVFPPPVGSHMNFVGAHPGSQDSDTPSFLFNRSLNTI